MRSFTSALYLGLSHPSGALRPWGRLTTGVPAALEEPPGAAAVAARLARLQGAQAGTLGSSTLHLFWDLLGLLAGRHRAVYVDAGAYPIARWGVERMAARGVRVTEFGHHDPVALRRALRASRRGERPLVVADGFCPGCGASAPLPDYLACARERDGRVAIDDTQALGVIGPRGGGSLVRCGLGGSGVLSIASLAKGLGVPVAVLSGPRADVEWFERRSETRTHTSPPAQPLVRAAGAALDANARIGDRLRRRLAALVGRFRRALGAIGLVPSGGLFPVQGLGGMTLAAAHALHEALLRRGVRTVLHADHMRPGGRVSFVISASHSEADVDAAARALAAIVRQPTGGLGRRRSGERHAAASSG